PLRQGPGPRRAQRLHAGRPAGGTGAARADREGADMGTVIYSMGMSLDGFIADPDGEIDWSGPDEELFQFHIDQTRELAVHLCGRRLYEAMLGWEAAPGSQWDPPELEFARIWRALPKVVFSSTLERVEGNARLATDDVATQAAHVTEGGTVGGWWR